MVICSPLFSWTEGFVYILEVGTRRPTSPPVGSPRPVFSKILLTKSEVCPATGDGTEGKERKESVNKYVPFFPPNLNVLNISEADNTSELKQQFETITSFLKRGEKTIQTSTATLTTTKPFVEIITRESFT